MKSFQELSISPKLMQAIEDMGIQTPTPIQEQAIPILLGEPTDFVGLAATGTGKTITFGVPLLESIEPAIRGVQGLILCPTRELALQVCGQISLLGKHLGVQALAIYGGAPFPDQIRGLRQGAQIVVGTPGRVVDHLTRGTLDLSHLQVVVLDEADEMISMGFKEELETILSDVPREHTRIWLFSATMGGEVRGFTRSYLDNPKQIQVNRTEIVPDRIEQIYYRAHESDKPEIICKLIDAADDFYGIIFCQTKSLVVDLTQDMRNKGYSADCLHGDMDQEARERAMKSFRDRKCTILVCTDVASRGLDVKDITHVINYSLPRELDNYVHRIGRTARSGKAGFAMNLVTPSHRDLIYRIEQITKSKMKEGTLPTRKEIGAKKVAGLMRKFQEQAHVDRAMQLLDDSVKASIAEMSREEIVSRFVAMTFASLFEDRNVENDARMVAGPEVVRAQTRGRFDRGGDRDRGGYRGDRGGFGGGGRRFDRGGDRDRGGPPRVTAVGDRADRPPLPLPQAGASASQPPKRKGKPSGKFGNSSSSFGGQSDQKDSRN